MSRSILQPKNQCGVIARLKGSLTMLIVALCLTNLQAQTHVNVDTVPTTGQAENMLTLPDTVQVLLTESRKEKRKEKREQREVEKKMVADGVVYPEFMGKNRHTFKRWVSQRLVYPKELIPDRIQGKVVTQIKINSEGELYDCVVLETSDPAFSEEVIRVVMQSPKWSPAMKDGMPVNCILTFPVKFIIPKEVRKNHPLSNSSSKSGRYY